MSAQTIVPPQVSLTAGDPVGDLLRIAFYRLSLIMAEKNVQLEDVEISPATKVRAIEILLTGSSGTLLQALSDAQVFTAEASDPRAALIRSAIMNLNAILLDDEISPATQVKAARLILMGAAGTLPRKMAEWKLSQTVSS